MKPKKKDAIKLTPKDFKRAERNAKTATPQVKKVIEKSISRGAVAKYGKPLAEAFERFKVGKSRASEIAAELKMPRGKVRKAFRDLAGGKAAYAAIMAQFAPVLPPRNAGKRDPRQLTIVDDKAAKHVKSPKERKRWKVRMYHPSKSAKPYELFTSPDGEQYVECHPLQKADVVLHLEDNGLRPWRLRQLSKKERVAEVKAKEQAKEAQQHRIAKKRAKRQERKTRRKGQLKK